MQMFRPLHLAVIQGFIEVVFSLVRILPDPRFLEIPNKKLQVFTVCTYTYSTAAQQLHINNVLYFHFC